LAGTELERYKKLIEIERDLASTLELDALLNRIIFAAKEITDSAAASILLYDPVEKQLFFHAATNMDPLLKGISVPMDSIAGWIFTHKSTLKIDDVKNDSRHFGAVTEKMKMVTRNLIGVPLISKGDVIGVLEVINREEGNYTTVDTDMLEALGVQAAIAIINSRLFHQSDHISEFVHELRTPLASIGTATYLLSRPGISEDKAKSILANISHEIKRLNDLATSFLELARLQSGRARYVMTRFDIEAVIDSSIQTLLINAEENKITLKKDVALHHAMVVGDKDKMTQVLINLISNAIKYNRENGEVIVRYGQDDERWWLEVEDNGFGIPKDVVPNLFQKFYRVKGMDNKVTGTGLGLSICKEIVIAHNGIIDVESVLDTGTRIRCNFPNH